MHCVVEWTGENGIKQVGLDLGIVDSRRMLVPLVNSREWNSVLLQSSQFEEVPVYDLDVSAPFFVKPEQQIQRGSRVCVSVVHMRKGFVEYKYGMPDLIVAEAALEHGILRAFTKQELLRYFHLTKIWITILLERLLLLLFCEAFTNLLAVEAFTNLLIIHLMK